MMGSWDGFLGAAIAATCGCCCALAQALAQNLAQDAPPQKDAQAQADAPAQIACGGETVAHATVGLVIDGRTFVLNDGREVRLAAIEAPPLPAPGGTASKQALEALIGGDEVILRQAVAGLDQGSAQGSDHGLDRYGRVVAYAYALRDGTELFTQGGLVASGFARVADRVGSKVCAAELLRDENTARAAKLGLWGDPYYEVLNADTPADVLAQRGRFALVEGQVVSVRESGSTIYVNFGRRWSESFAVTILKRNERNFAAAGLDLKALAGRRVRVRGWVEARGADGNVPWIEAARPEQIETADQN